MSTPRSISPCCLMLCLSVLSTGCRGQNTDDVLEIRQGILRLYARYAGATTSSNPADLIFVLDRSASVTESGWLSMLRFVQNFLEPFILDEDNARVAVISYSTTVSLDIDGISSGQYNKCAFVARLQGQMAKKVPRGYSATHDALLRAKDVALTSRPDVKKAVIVITNGKSSVGPPPNRASVQLRSLTWDQDWNVRADGPQLQVYVFGIKDAYMPEVRSIATPLPNHTFYLPTFQAFRQLARSLHGDSQSERWQVLGDSSCHGICDQHAFCACSIRSGQHLCICRRGYQGDGTVCTACPRGTYKKKTSPSRCVMCPSNSTTLVEGATDIDQCVCQPPFYQNAPGHPCQLRYCERLPDIEHGHKFHVAGVVVDQVPDTNRPCLNLPGSSCHVGCNVGYHLDDLTGLVCLSNGSWEGRVPSCQIVDCGQLSFHQQEPEHTIVEYVNQTTSYSSILRVTCDKGWLTFGDRDRVCTQYGAWSGTQAWCVDNHCPVLALSPGLIIMPATCGQVRQVPGDVCQFMCQPGYELNGPSRLECTDHGKWDKEAAAECVDRLPPSITCAANITTPVTTANFAIIEWKSYQPLVTDNSGEFIITIIGVAESNDSLRLTAGVHQIKYIARDKAGNEASCVQRITVLDFIVHLVTCPDEDITINMISHQQEAVWPTIVFADHNNITVTHKCVPANNTLLPAGIYTVTCIPDTHTYQQAQCNFRAIFRQPKCDIPPPPLHGNVNCSSTPTSLQTCIPYCQDGFDFFYLPQSGYICDLEGNWNLQVFWPDCSRTYYPRKAILPGHVIYHYSGDNCDEIKEEIAIKFASWLQKQVFEICNINTCGIGTPRVSCGEKPRRKRRSTALRFINSDKASDYVPLRYQVGISASLKNLLPEKVTKISKEISTEVANRGRQIKYLSLLNFPLDSRRGRISTETYQKQPREENTSVYKDSIEFIHRNHYMKRSVSKNSVLNYTKNTKMSQINLKTHQEIVTVKESKYQTTTYGIYEYSNNKEQESDSHNGKGVMTRHWYQTENTETKNKNQITKTNTGVSNKKDFVNSQGSFKRIEETTKSSRVVNGNVKNGLKKETESIPSFAESTLTVPEISEQLPDTNELSKNMVVPLEEDSQQSESPTHTYPKRSVRGVTQNFDNFDADYDNNDGPSGSNSVPPLQYFLDNVTPQSFYDEDTDEVKIEFVVTKESFTGIQTEWQQSDFLVDLLNVFNRLISSLDSFNLTLDDNNATSSSNDSNILYAISHVIDKPILDACDSGYIRRSEVSLSTQICVACPGGSKYDYISSQCLVCDPAYYQPNEAQPDCLKCPNNTMTEFSGANNISMCLAVCTSGQFSGTGLSPCQPCPLNSYQPMSTATTCLPCPMGRKTLGTGAVHAAECLELCDPGMYSETGLVLCMPCQVGYYQPNHGATDCLLCGDGLTTASDQAANISDCIARDDCSSTECVENGGTCVVGNNVATCVCASGFSGASCEINMPDCFVSSCQNNGTCIDGNNTYTCDCLPGFTGTKCEVNIDECLSSPCQHGSSCLDLFNGYQCFCLFDYTGAHCETKILLCDESICINGRCEEKNGVAVCICSQGFAGHTCNTTIDLCSSLPCAHNGRCESSPGHFQCHCLQGFTGTLCDTVVDPCENSNCSKDSLCMPAQNGQFGYLCKCSSGWSGKFCEYESTADFDLVFDANGPDGQYVVLPPEFMPSLVDFTVCTWLRPQPLSAFATIVAFTLPVSSLTLENNDYHAGKETVDFDTIFAIKHTDKLIVNIFNHSLPTNVTITFMVWSHLCVTWSCTSSHWQVVVNGSLSAEGTLGHTWTSLPSHSQVVLGQNNPYYAEASMSWEVFAGEITQLNIFSHVLSMENLRSLANGRACNTTFGDVISWTDVSSYVQGDLVLREISHCLDINECWFPSEFPCGNNRECVDLIGSYNCSICMYGYTGGNCDLPEDECALDTCARGECVDGGPEPYDFQCVCPPGVTGYLCDVIIDLCLAAPCQNGGTCISGLNNFTCSCPLTNMGPLCEINSDICFPNPCKNHGLCLKTAEDAFKCHCSDNFAGNICERRKHWCDGDFCHNGGVCQNQSVSRNNSVDSHSQEGSCRCNNGWMGQRCQVRMVPSCELSPCANGGSCLDLLEDEQGYRCQCLDTPGIKVDENCEYLTPCDQSPCTNNTICVHFANYTFKCLCVDGLQCEPHDGGIISNSSDHGQIYSPSTEKIATSPSGASLSSAEIWAIAAVTVIFGLLVVVMTGCFLWRRKYKRSDGEVLIMSDVDEHHLSNPTFHSEETQIEENTYAELGGNPAEGFASQEGNRKFASFPQSSSGAYIPSSTSGSFSSVRSPGSKKPSEEDDLDTPLLFQDYLEPGGLEMATSPDLKLADPVSTNSNIVLPRLGVSNDGFHPDNYVVSENNLSRQAVTDMDRKEDNSADEASASESDKNRLVSLEIHGKPI